LLSAAKPAAVLSSYRPYDRHALLAHELFHVLSRNDQDVRDRLYALLTFDRVEPAFHTAAGPLLGALSRHERRGSVRRHLRGGRLHG
jgi:hypothetical protein